MTYYDEGVAMPAEPEPTDPRIVAVHRVVDLERQHNAAQREVEKLQKTAAIVGEELRQARDELSGLLGYPSNARMQAMNSEKAEAIARRMNR